MPNARGQCGYAVLDITGGKRSYAVLAIAGGKRSVVSMRRIGS